MARRDPKSRKRIGTCSQMELSEEVASGYLTPSRLSTKASYMCYEGQSSNKEPFPILERFSVRSEQ